MKKSVLRAYAHLIAAKGGAVQKGQVVIISASLEQPEFVTMVAEECYKCGAKEVIVDWHHQPLTKLSYRKRSVRTLSKVEDWEIEKLRWKTDVLPVQIYLESDDPDGLKGINQAKISKSSQARYKVTKPFRDAMENRYQWCIAAVPGAAWAKKVFPGLSKRQAMEKLWEAILMTSRVDTSVANPDPVAAWDVHNADLTTRYNYLNSLDITALEYKSANGTDFRVGMIPGALFMGGSEKVLGNEVWYNPNIPSEEIFTSPRKGDAEGIVYASKPLSYRGQLIEHFSVRFEGGKAVEVHAEKGEELLKEMIGMDKGAAYLGEVALVPYDSPIRNSGVLFYNTLFDENAACHLALGAGFTNVLPGFDKMTLQECYDKGVNDSMIHVDFMIGTEDLSIVALTRDGKRVPIFKDGNWAF